MKPLNLLPLLLLATCNLSLAGDSRPNILWIVAENLKLDLGCYGAKNVVNPNLDNLAANGVRYTHVFSTPPVCAPSRSAFFVGMYQTTSDTHNMRSHREDGYRLPEGVRPITHRLKDVGYHTANIKTIGAETVVMFFGDNGRIEPRGIHWCYDTGLHVPMIIHWPKNFPAPANYKPGTVSDEVVSLIDITPTTLGFAGIDRPLGGC